MPARDVLRLMTFKIFSRKTCTYRQIKILFHCSFRHNAVDSVTGYTFYFLKLNLFIATISLNIHSEIELSMYAKCYIFRRCRRRRRSLHNRSDGGDFSFAYQWMDNCVRIVDVGLMQMKCHAHTRALKRNGSGLGCGLI